MATTVKTLRLTVQNTLGTQTISLREPIDEVDGSVLSNFNTAVNGSGVSINDAQYVTTTSDDKIAPATTA